MLQVARLSPKLLGDVARSRRSIFCSNSCIPMAASRTAPARAIFITPSSDSKGWSRCGPSRRSKRSRRICGASGAATGSTSCTSPVWPRTWATVSGLLGRHGDGMPAWMTQRATHRRALETFRSADGGYTQTPGEEQRDDLRGVSGAGRVSGLAARHAGCGAPAADDRGACARRTAATPISPGWTSG